VLGAGEELLLDLSLFMVLRLLADRVIVNPLVTVGTFVITGGVNPPPWMKLSLGMLLIGVLNPQGMVLGALVGVVPVMVENVAALVNSEGANVDMSITSSDSV